MHIDTRDHKCGVCQENFTSRQMLQQHAAVHTGELDCPFCDKTFKWKHSLNDHIRAHNGNIPMQTVIHAGWVLSVLLSAYRIQFTIDFPISIADYNSTLMGLLLLFLSLS